MSGVLGVIEDRDTYSFVAHRSVIIHPSSSLAPGVAIFDPLTINNVSVSNLAFQTHRFGETHSHGSLFGIAKSDFPVGSLRGNFKVKHLSGGPIVNPDRTNISRN